MGSAGVNITLLCKAGSKEKEFLLSRGLMGCKLDCLLDVDIFVCVVRTIGVKPVFTGL